MKLEKLSLKLAIILLSVVVATGCVKTYIPQQTTPNQISFSGNNHNAGFIGFAEDGSGVIDTMARLKYNSLISIYATNFIPRIYFDYGVKPYTNETFLITKEGLSKFATMNRWSKNAKQ